MFLFVILIYFAYAVRLNHKATFTDIIYYTAGHLSCTKIMQIESRSIKLAWMFCRDADYLMQR